MPDRVNPVANSESSLVLRALGGERTERTPVWFMRQAGRSDPAYLKVREKRQLPLEELFANVEMAIEISLLPRRIGVDAIIFFQDILTPLGPMGARFLFRPGPVLENPIRTEADIDALVKYDVSSGLPFVGRTLSWLRKELDGRLPLLGFAGAPLTLFYFMVEGGSPSRGANAEALLAQSPKACHRLLQKITEVTIEYLKYQIASGAQAVQLFESAADLPTLPLYEEFALPFQQQIFEALRGVAPTILFAKGFRDLALLKRSGADALSLAQFWSISEARQTLGEGFPLQGNLDNHLLVNGSMEEVETAAIACLKSGGHQAHVFNLSHGLLQQTSWERVTRLVEIAKSFRCETC